MMAAAKNSSVEKYFIVFMFMLYHTTRITSPALTDSENNDRSINVGCQISPEYIQSRSR